jgi:hypothetical protein
VEAFSYGIGIGLAISMTILLAMLWYKLHNRSKSKTIWSEEDDMKLMKWLEKKHKS